jgi:glycerol dehydrogenase-like iron-containing ADH family enzyme
LVTAALPAAELGIVFVLTEEAIVSIASLIRQLHTTKPTAGRAVEALVRAGTLAEITGRKRGCSGAYENYIDRLSEGMEPTQ